MVQLMLGVGAQRRWLGNTTPGPFTPGKQSTVLIVQEAGWVPRPVWLDVEDKICLAAVGVRTPIRLARNQWLISTKLSRHYPKPKASLKSVMRNQSWIKANHISSTLKPEKRTCFLSRLCFDDAGSQPTRQPAAYHNQSVVKLCRN
jgi:hypothetical protein